MTICDVLGVNTFVSELMLLKYIFELKICKQIWFYFCFHNKTYGYEWSSCAVGYMVTLSFFCALVNLTLVRHDEWICLFKTITHNFMIVCAPTSPRIPPYPQSPLSLCTPLCSFSHVFSDDPLLVKYVWKIWLH